jgi:uncharacterized protein (DUF885 family)
VSRISAFADALLWDMLSLSPDLAAELGLGDVNGRALPVGGLIDGSDAAVGARRAMMARRRTELTRLPTADLDDDDRTTSAVLRYLLDEGAFGAFAGAAGRSFPEAPYPVNHLSGWHQGMVMMLVRDSVIADADGAEAYLQQMAAIPAAIDGVIAAMAAREAEGIAPPRSTLRKSLAEIEAFLAAARNPLVDALRNKAAATIEPAASAHAERGERLWRGTIAPAYARLLSAIEAQLARAGDDAGLWRLPDGDAWYAWLLRSHTTTDLTPEAVHEIGLAETARVQDQIRAEFGRLGIAGGSISELFAAISGPEHAAFSGEATSRTAALERTTEVIETLAARAAPLFARLPRAGVDVTLVPEESEDSIHSQYTPPAPTSGRPGRFSLNLKSTLAQPGWELPVLCAHEATPGHHTQLALAQELPLCAFRRTVVFTAYIEGWAKYAETMLDHQLMDDPYVRLGRLRGELYSSVNLALDTGVHARCWSRGQAARFFSDQTGVSGEFAESIVDRSLVWPGQLTAYKIGMLKLAELRQNMAWRPGGTTPQAFHSAVLERGALPLSLLAGAAAA